jgi:hypothetical protein
MLNEMEQMEKKKKTKSVYIQQKKECEKQKHNE